MRMGRSSSGMASTPWMVGAAVLAQVKDTSGSSLRARGDRSRGSISQAVRPPTTTRTMTVRVFTLSTLRAKPPKRQGPLSVARTPSRAAPLRS